MAEVTDEQRVQGAPHAPRLRARIGWWLRCAADRIDPEHAYRVSALRYGYIENVGLVVGAEHFLPREVGARLYCVSADPADRDAAWHPELENYSAFVSKVRM